MEKVKKVTSEVTLQLLLLCKACSVMHQLNTACYHFLKLSFNLSDKRPCVKCRWVTNRSHSTVHVCINFLDHECKSHNHPQCDSLGKCLKGNLQSHKCI